MKCNRCGREAPEDTTTCPACGEFSVRPLPAEEYPAWGANRPAATPAPPVSDGDPAAAVEPVPATSPASEVQPLPAALAAISAKDKGTLILFSALFGSFGLDRFYRGQVALGLLKLMTFGGCGIWALIDTVIYCVGNNQLDADGREIVDRRSWHRGGAAE